LFQLPSSCRFPLHNPDLLLRQPIKFVHDLIDQLIRRSNALHQWLQLRQGRIELQLQPLLRLPSGRIVVLQLSFILLEDGQQLIELQPVIFLDFRLGREVLDLGPDLRLQPAQEALNLLLLIFTVLSNFLLNL
jgi:hypothetical protein